MAISVKHQSRGAVWVAKEGERARQCNMQPM